MNTTYHKIILAVSLVLVLGILLPSLVLADLPERPEDAEPATEPPKSRKGAGIELSVTGATEPYYAVVQWQDGGAGAASAGEWHDVDGWRGQVEDGCVLWFVPESLFEKRPFRWVVYDDEGTLGSSESFTMPSYKGQIVRVIVTL
jgi:hypothetical protein